PAGFHEKVIAGISKVFSGSGQGLTNFRSLSILRAKPARHQKLIIAILAIHFLIQIVFPFRYLLYPGKLFWTEEGYRFSWRVMLMEKAGYTQFTVTDSKTKKTIRVINNNFLTPFQEKQMSFQPDFILEYAH